MPELDRVHRPPLTDTTLDAAVDALAARDADLGASVARYGRPPMWAREPGFPTLVHIVLEQQVSLASAKAAFDRLRAAADPLTPDAFLELDDARLLEIGFSRQKTRYGRALAAALLDGSLDLGRPDLAARRRRGRGPDGGPRHRALDGHHLPADGAAAALMRGPSTTSPSRRRSPTSAGLDRRPDADGDARARRGLEALARRGRPDPVAPLPEHAPSVGRLAPDGRRPAVRRRWRASTLASLGARGRPAGGWRPVPAARTAAPYAVRAMPLYRLEHPLPTLDRPTVLAAFDGWVDAGSAATTALAVLGEGAQAVAAFDADAVFDYRARRPTLDIRDGRPSSLEWPELVLRHARHGGRDLLLLGGPEPDFRWHALADDMTRAARAPRRPRVDQPRLHPGGRPPCPARADPGHRVPAGPPPRRRHPGPDGPAARPGGGALDARDGVRGGRHPGRGLLRADPALRAPAATRPRRWPCSAPWSATSTWTCRAATSSRRRASSARGSTRPSPPTRPPARTSSASRRWWTRSASRRATT